MKKGKTLIIIMLSIVFFIQLIMNFISKNEVKAYKEAIDLSFQYHQHYVDSVDIEIKNYKDSIMILKDSCRAEKYLNK
ncbi:MAG: hypothetical protein CVU09_01560 [Bacteroidetes bacterium HGW-Bacteroidetes-4]|jgi:hypothetical protein|nr:MAG: hypothetical protein CVU09_01560 [Bacteroidetes bacterium HGW-Bacteroidetes-4]